MKKAMNQNNQIKKNQNGPLIIKEGEISILSSNKNEDKTVIKRVTFDEKGKYRISHETDNEPLHEQFINWLLNPLNG